MASEVRDAIKSKLATDSILTGLAPGGIFSDEAPKGAEFPYIIFFKQSGVPIHSFRGQPMDNMLYVVKGVGEKKAHAEAIDARCRAILHRADLGAVTFSTLYLLIESDLEMTETNAGERYDHVGTVYRLITDPKES